MSDCAETTLREALPDLINDTLDAVTVARIRAHLSTCAECRDELALLQDVRSTWRASVPIVDPAGILAAIPKPTPVLALHPAARRRSWVSAMRVAAAVGLLAVGGVSVAVSSRIFWSNPQGDTLAVVTSRPAAPVDSPQVPVRTGMIPSSSVVADLHDDDLEALIGSLDALEAAPAADPDSLIIVRAGEVTGGA